MCEGVNKQGEAAMKSGKQRRKEMTARRLQLRLSRAGVSKRSPWAGMTLNRVAADATQLVHNNTYGVLPTFYEDYAFTCRDCGSHEVWKAARQKWWFEVAKGAINSRAVRCRSCHLIERARVAEARRGSQEGLARKIEMQKKLKEEQK